MALMDFVSNGHPKGQQSRGKVSPVFRGLEPFGLKGFGIPHRLLFIDWDGLILTIFFGVYGGHSGVGRGGNGEEEKKSQYSIKGDMKNASGVKGGEGKGQRRSSQYEYRRGIGN